MVRFFSKWVTPDQMTALRVLLIPVIYGLVLIDNESILVLAWVVFVIACLTDWWDGILARHLNKPSDLGRLLDPIADKMLIASLLVLLVEMDRAPALPVALILVREFAVSGLRSVAVVKGLVISASSGGKYKTISQMFAVGFLILHHSTLGVPTHEVGIVVLWGATLLSLWSGYKYFHAYQQTNSLSED